MKSRGIKSVLSTAEVLDLSFSETPILYTPDDRIVIEDVSSKYYLLCLKSAKLSGPAYADS